MRNVKKAIVLILALVFLATCISACAAAPVASYAPQANGNAPMQAPAVGEGRYMDS